MNEQNANGLLFKPEDNVPNLEAGILGLQHVLAMDVYVAPLIIASMLALSVDQTSQLLQSAFLACGIGTILQTAFFMKIPLCQGPSFVPATAIVGVFFASGGQHGGMAAVIGSCLAGSLMLILFGATGIYEKVINKLLPSVVGGTIITCVGLGSFPSSLNSNIFKASGNTMQNVELAGITLLTFLIVTIIGTYIPQLHQFLKISSVIITMIVGVIAASLMGRMDWTSFNKAALFSFPQATIFHYGVSFNPSAILTFIIIFLVLTTETTGTWFAMSAATDEKITPKQWNHGMIGEGVSCLISAFLGSIPMTGYSTNAGIISITGVASRKVFISAGAWFIILGFFSKISALLSAIPKPVIGGVSLVIMAIIMLNGINVIGDINAFPNKNYIVGIPIAMTMAMTFLPNSIKLAAPKLLQYLLGSPISIAAITAVVLNLLLSKKQAIINSATSSTK
ncbi:purine/pyrimidine permease [Lactobacillus sp. ESL0731]|uniref:uracil-xanthine permease family protein n=1 Tax=unclassified Lactobacillus TaxID=2620435 RepID=UPI0023F845B9|nr:MULTISPECIES: solute carrier family 23 protein [unclassified Lactobacillus]WEV51497.1 purine/pyrimidine permease [Lactobacillus sp. ESL0700]WEV62626.1 purine/pyrimidine permease [Lactobacillus sp. ESL0731]